MSNRLPGVVRGMAKLLAKAACDNVRLARIAEHRRHRLVIENGALEDMCEAYNAARDQIDRQIRITEHLRQRIKELEKPIEVIVPKDVAVRITRQGQQPVQEPERAGDE